ncbi:MAG: pantoate--beta-alanine ligase [Pacificimonas sp.]
MKIVRTVTALRDQVEAWRRAKEIVALVPTMGALHQGHLSLVTAARREADRVIASIFVNPTQFAPGEDLDAYPRPEHEDRVALETANCDLLYMPSASEMYPDGFATTVHVAELSARLCGGTRPTHFDGVSTVVTKLLNQAQPDMALFGEKDWQQLTIIRRAVRDLDIPVTIVGVPTVRGPDGLALSSRNAYLTQDERDRAPKLAETIAAAISEIERGQPVDDALAFARDRLRDHGFTVDYVELRGAHDLEPMATLDRPARLFAAAFLGEARLIDNFPVNPF